MLLLWLGGCGAAAVLKVTRCCGVEQVRLLKLLHKEGMENRGLPLELQKLQSRKVGCDFVPGWSSLLESYGKPSWDVGDKELGRDFWWQKSSGESWGFLHSEQLC